MNMLYWIGEKQNKKVEITIISKCIHQFESAFNKPLNLLEQHAINKTQEKDIQHPTYA